MCSFGTALAIVICERRAKRLVNNQTTDAKEACQKKQGSYEMKFLMKIAVLLIPICASASPIESSVGVYAECAKWTTINGVEHSKGFEYALNEDQSQHLEIRYYTGTAKCEGDGEVLMRAENFQILDRIGKFPQVLIMTLKDADDGDYYSLMFGGDSLVLTSSDKLPVEYDINRTLILTKVQ
jgi:hypothetical protein